MLDRCLGHQPRAWNDFVDRYMGLIYHVIHHVGHSRSVALSEADIEDIAAAEVAPARIEAGETTIPLAEIIARYSLAD